LHGTESFVDDLAFLFRAALSDEPHIDAATDADDGAATAAHVDSTDGSECFVSLLPTVPLENSRSKSSTQFLRLSRDYLAKRKIQKIRNLF
jgi:hypothetical protein